MKSFTDIEQSRKLAEILPIESADMYYSSVPVREWKDKTDVSKGTQVVFKYQIFAIENLPNHEIGEGDIPCWTLVALLSILPKIHGLKPIIDLEESSIQYSGIDLYVTGADIIDACVEIIFKLNELKML